MFSESAIKNTRTVENRTSSTCWNNNWSPSSERHFANYEVACDIDSDLQYHIQHCPCTCNHLGYGNYFDYQTACVLDNEDATTVHCVLEEQRLPCNGSVCRSTSRTEPINCTIPVNLCKDYEFHLRLCMIGIGTATMIIFLCLIVSGYVSDTTSDIPSSSSLENRHNAIKALLQEVPLIDGHNDLPWNLKKFVHNQLQKVNLSTDLRLVEPWSKSRWSQTDIQRMRVGMIGAQFWSAYVPCETQYKNAVTLMLEQIDVIKRFVQTYNDELAFVTSAAGIKEAHKRGRIASLIGIEGGHALSDSLGVLRMYYELGVRYLTLTHKCDTLWASCCIVGNNPAALNATGKIRGLTLFGQGIVREMNRLGMLIDLSHTSVHTMEDTLNVSLAPVIFSHSSAYAICNSNRNVPDHILKKLAENGGVIMVTFYPHFISCDTLSTVEQVIAHINHIRDVAGEDHVGLGSGYDGINRTTDGLEDVSHFPDLLDLLIVKHKWSHDQLKKLVGLNILRVLQRAEKVRDDLKNVQPDEDSILAHYHYKTLPNDCAIHDL